MSCILKAMSSLKAVPYTPNSLDIVTEISEFFAQTCHLYINGTLSNYITFTTDGVDYLIAGKHPATVTGKIM